MPSCFNLSAKISKDDTYFFFPLSLIESVVVSSDQLCHGVYIYLTHMASASVYSLRVALWKNCSPLACTM